MRYLLILSVSAAVFLSFFMLDFSGFNDRGSLCLGTAQAYYGQGRRVARRTARRTARRVSRRHNYYRGAAYAAPVVAAGAAALAVGATVVSLPPACSNVVINGVTYYQCGGTYYQAAYDGPNVVYVVVQPPR